MKYTAHDLTVMDQRYRALFVNSLSGFKSANLIGTQNKSGEHNLCIISSVFHVGANPPLMGLLMRPHTVRRDTLENIKETGLYTINHVCTDIIDKAHQTSARYDQHQSEFTETGLTPWFSDSFNAPYVAESHVKIGLKLEEIHSLEINQTELVIGRIHEVILDENAVAQDGYIDIESLQSVSVSSLDSYHSTVRVDRYEYAKPDTPPKRMKDNTPPD